MMRIRPLQVLMTESATLPKHTRRSAIPIQQRGSLPVNWR